MKKRLDSFGHAFRGIVVVVSGQPNARIHLAATAAVVVLGLLLEIDRMEWVAVSLAAAVVWAAEGLNTALEILADHTAPERHPSVGRAKDAAAAGVLLASMGALATGLLVFLPRIM